MIRATASLTSRPVSLGQHRLPVRRRLPARHRADRLRSGGRARSSSWSRTTWRCTASTTCSTTSPTCATRARAAPRARCWTGRVHRGIRAAAAIADPPVRHLPGGAGRPAAWRPAWCCASSLVAVYAYCVPGLRFKERPFLDSADLQHPLRRARGLRAGARRGAVHAGDSGRCSRPSSSGAWPATPSARCRMSCPTARPASRSIATALGARRDGAASAAAFRRRAADAGHRLARPAGRAAGAAVHGQRAAASLGCDDAGSARRQRAAGGASSG